jgi:predicted amidohydrolase YtcJ
MKLILGGVVVSSGEDFRADVAIEGGRIAAIGPSIAPKPGDEVIDARGLLVFPGFIDAHTHFDMDNGVTVTADDFASGTRAAVAAAPPASSISPPRKGAAPWPRRWPPGTKRPTAAAFATTASTWPSPTGTRPPGPSFRY